LAVLGLGIPIGLFLLLFTWQNLEVIRLGHEATNLQKQRKDIEDTNKALQLELDRLTALGAVEQKATALGFAATEPKNVVTVTGDLTSPGAEPVTAGGSPERAPSSARRSPSAASRERR
jgi:hypothetical protein